MSINWRVRAKNPTFWAQVACAVVLPLVVGTGAQWEDMTSWPTLWSAILGGLSNPVVVVTMVASLWACVTDPTTKGTGDSAAALAYDKPKED